MLIYKNYRKKDRVIRYGRYKGGRTIIINKQKYYLEESRFENYQMAIHYYFKIVSDIYDYGEIIEVKEDYYDWSNTVFRFEHSTIKLIRIIDKIIMMKSSEPITVMKIERDSFKLMNSINDGKK